MYKKGKVHPSPPLAVDHLSLLPATILALAAALSAEDKHILAYLISCCGGGDTHRRKAQKKNSGEHDPVFECSCFNCYLSYWARWDVSPNRQVIDEIIEAYEEWLLKRKKKSSRKKKGKTNTERNFEEMTEVKIDIELVESNSSFVIQDVDLELEKSMASKIGNFVRQRIWGFWG